MAAAWLLTALALIGIVLGASLGQSKTFSAHLAAAGGGLLSGICLFWLMPEIAETAGWPGTIALAAIASLVLILLDRYLEHTGNSPRHGAVLPLLIATAVHSFLDGWSVRALALQPLTDVAVPVGLALHKVPEGLALGWILRRDASSTRAVIMGAVVESLTVIGAAIEPRAERSGVAAFGAWWTAVVLSIVAGTFLFLGFHTVAADWKKRGVMPVFVCALVAAALAARLV